MSDAAFERAKAAIRAWLDQSDLKPVTDDEIEELVQSFRHLPDVDDSVLQRLKRFVEEHVIITTPDATTLERLDHRPWLQNRAGDFGWQFWERYKRHLTEQSSLPSSVVDRIDESTDTILDHLEDPAAPHAWDRRGLVVGQVQSGKTANYLGVIAKAIDVGYRVIIVLAGADNDLRAQTQIRLEEGIIGWNTSSRRVNSAGGVKRVGVGKLQPRPDLSPNPQTTREQDGDFKAAAASVMKEIGTDPLILVVKKNRSVLENVRKYLTSVSAELGPDERRTVRSHPLLMVDDEADHYSVNTAAPDPETDPTTINGLVRDILNCFERSAYVGYTATAFANIFIALDDASEKHGDTLFPSDFIVNVHPPSNYVGATRVFGLSDRSLGEPADPLPVVRICDDAEDWLPSKHKKTAPLAAFLPDSLEDALDSFLLTIAARRARGNTNVHNSMLVHVTRFNDVQEAVRVEIDGRLRKIKTRLRQGDDDNTVERLRELWEKDYEPTTAAMAGSTEFGKLPALSWSDIRGHVRPAAESIVIRTVNGMAKDVLDYAERSDSGLNVIAIGGNKLSRGLTLEGLSVSYYLRTSRAYDTLLQMGRWFGYRNGYVDLCRLYTTSQLQGWYRDITLANAELTSQIDRMADSGATPREFGLRVRTNPNGLMVSSPNKVRATQKVTLSFENQTREQVAYSRHSAKKRQSLDALDRMLTAVAEFHDEADPKANTRLTFDKVPGEHVMRFLRETPTNPEARLTRTDLMADYVEDRLQAGELEEWRIVVLSPSSGNRRTHESGGFAIGLSERASDRRSIGPKDSEPTTTTEQYRVDRILGSEDMKEGLVDEQIERALSRAKNNPKVSLNDALREERGYGLLFLALLDPSRANANAAVSLSSDAGKYAKPYVGLTVVFPTSKHPNSGRQYLIGEVYSQMQLGWGDEE